MSFLELSKNMGLSLKCFILNIWTEGINLGYAIVKNTAAVNNLLKMSKKYSNVSLISLGALTGSGIAFICGLSFMSILPKVSSKLFVKLVGGMFVAVPSAGILGGTLVSKYLLRPTADSTKKFRKFADVTLVSLSAVASASLILVLGLGTLSVVNTLLPGLSTSVSLATIALAPLGGIAGGSKILNMCNANSSIFCSRTPERVVSDNFCYIPKNFNSHEPYKTKNISRNDNRKHSNNISADFCPIRTINNSKHNDKSK